MVINHGIVSIFFCLQFFCVNCRYTEGILKTSEKWAFLVRFCFLSEEGEFEYEIEYNQDHGIPNLLLYYDTDDQWPIVYKSNKTCEEKESVLNIKQNQIVNLTTSYPLREMSGCSIVRTPAATSRTYSMIVPTVSTPKPKIWPKSSLSTTFPTHTPTTIKMIDEIISTTDVTHNSDDYSFSTESTTWETSQYFLSTEEMSSTKDSYTIEPTIVTRKVSPEQTIKNRKQKRSVPTTKPTPTPVKYYLESGKVTCHNARRFRSSRERWWFIAISNCKGMKGIDLKYRFLMTNGPAGDYWHEHFSADEFYILPVLMAFSIVYSFLILGIVMCTIELRSRQLLHTTYKLFVFSVVLQLFGILCMSSCYLKLALNGLLVTNFRRFGQILMGASETTFLMLLLLLAKGFTITRGRLPVAASIKLTIFMCLYVITYISIFIYEAQVFDPGEVLYLYESPAGYGLILLRIFAWCMFVYSTIFTLKHYPEKANFYYPFNIFGTVWFVAGPAFILSANTYIDKWVRESVVCAILLLITFGGHLMFLILTMPSVANKNFPYHVRTSQIGIMEMNGTAGNSTIEQFGHHVYEPAIHEQTVIIPLTKRTEEIFEGMYNQKNTDILANKTIEDQRNSAFDVAIENVMNWSTAKNVHTLEIPNFERNNMRNSAGSAHSQMTANSNPVSLISRNASFNRLDQYQNGINDYVREVPIELFTVSKMVITTNSFAKRSNPRQDETD